MSSYGDIYEQKMIALYRRWQTLVRPKDDRCRHSLSLVHAIRQRQHVYDDTRKQQETSMIGVRIERSHMCTKGCTRQEYTRQGMRASVVGVRAVMRAPRDMRIGEARVHK